MNPQKPPGGIEWTRVHGRPGYTSNPIRGCMHRCEWEMPDGTIAICYAKGQAEGPAMKRAYPNGFESLSWHPKELEEIQKTKKPSGIFIDSMSDLFGAEVPDEWIDRVLLTINDCPQHVFLSLTKNPPRLLKFRMPQNMWVGISAPPTFMYGKRLTEKQQDALLIRGLQCLDECDCSLRWISIEPLSYDISAHLVQFGKRLNWAVIGAASKGRITFQPRAHDFDMALYAMKGRPVFFKGNLSKFLANEIAGGWRAEFPELESL